MRDIFPRLIGNEKTKQRLFPLIKSERLPHAFLIDGPEGSGRYTLALELASAINCRNKDKDNLPLPCGICDICKKIKDESSVDVKVLAKDKDKSSIGVNEVKEFRQDMYLSTTEAEYAVYIIKDAEKLTAEAQNALLIVLEEPPKNVKIILIANGTDRILTTIRSRTQYITTSRFTTEELTKAVARPLDISEERFLALARCADGRIGRLQELSSRERAEETEEKRRTAMGVVDALGTRAKYSSLLVALTSLPDKRAELTEALEDCINAVRDMIAAKNTEDFTPLFFLTKEEAKTKAKDVNLRRLIGIYEIISSGADACSKNANVGIILTDMAAKIKKT